MTLTQLEYIVAVDAYKNFVVAADKCHVTQPTLSMQIRKLEDGLGVRIFDRSRQPVIATDLGAEIVARARIILAECDQVRELISDRQEQLSGELKFGIIPTLSPYLLPKWIGGFTASHPQVKLSAWELTTGEMIRQLKLGLIDCGILSTPLTDPALSCDPVFYERFVVYASPESKLWTKSRIASSDIDMGEMLILDEGHCMRNQVLNICQHHKPAAPDRQFEYHSGSVETLKHLVDEKGGATILPELSLLRMNAADLEHIRYFKSPQPSREISIVTHRDYVKKRIIAALKKSLIALLDDDMKQRTDKAVMEIW